MGLFKKKEPIDEELERVLGGFTNNDLFRRKLEDHGLSRNTPNLPYKKVLKAEFELGYYEVYEVENRLNELLKENLTSKDLSKLLKELNQEIYDKSGASEKLLKKSVDTILANGRVGIKVPDKMDAIANAALGGIAFGDFGRTMGALTGGKIEWIGTDLILTDDGLTIFRTGQGIPYDEITHVQIAKLNDYTMPIVNIISEYGTNNLIFKCIKADALKVILNDMVPNLKSEEIKDSKDDSINESNQSSQSNESNESNHSNHSNQSIESKSNNSSADELIKYAELFEKGFLTKEEFEAKKNELL